MNTFDTRAEAEALVAVEERRDDGAPFPLGPFRIIERTITDREVPRHA